MKYKKALLKLAWRVKDWEAMQRTLSETERAAFKKPGSQNRRAG